MKSQVDHIANSESNMYDFSFIGLGASNSLIVLSLIKNGLLKGKKVLILEVSSKSNNDKTYCFWSSYEDSIISDLSPIISHQFDKIKVNNSNIQNIVDQPYFYIRSIDLYEYTLAQLNQEKINIERVEVNNIIEDQNFYSISTQEQSFKTRFIFDSRPPSEINLHSDDIYINQSFFGLHIQCENAVFQNDAFEMMNFNVEQNGATQFFYVIPFSPHEALIELTRFGQQKIDLNYASDLLKKHILKEFGPYKIVADETGCIPMTTFENEPSSSRGILKTGTSANLIKPSTGYGFKNMHSFAEKVSQRISQNQYDHFNTIHLNRKKRFKFYDTLLLIILLMWPLEGKTIFTQLYKKQSAIRIFTFLDEKTTFYNELKIFASLPIITFLRALYVFLKSKRYLRYIVALLIVSTYLLLDNLNQDSARIFSYTALSIGLVGLGIPHGALDHLLLKTKQFSLPFFLFKYSTGIILYYILWQLFPLFSLLLFIVYSSLHFGESELVEIKTKLPSPFFTVKSFLLGFSVLLFIISTHAEESMQVLTYLNLNIELTKYSSENLSLALSILSFSAILIQNLLSKGNPYFGLLFLLVLGIPTPLIVAFGLYFVLQHSDNAWKHLKHGLKMNSIGLYKKASLYTLGAFLVFGLIILNAEKLDSFHALWTQFFIFISCISLPHFIIMHLFYKEEF
jgi:lycopene beta-cyclase